MREIRWHLQRLAVRSSIWRLAAALALVPFGLGAHAGDALAASQARCPENWTPLAGTSIARAPTGGTGYELRPVIDDHSTLSGYRLSLGTARPTAIRLPAESFVTDGPDRTLIVSRDNGRRSRVSFVRPDTGCQRVLVRLDQVVRGAVFDSARERLDLHLVRRATRRDMGVWSYSLETHEIRQTMPGLASTSRIGPVFGTSLDLDATGRSLTVTSCGIDLCRTRRLDRRSGAIAAANQPAPHVLDRNTPNDHADHLAPLMAGPPSRPIASNSTAAEPTPAHKTAAWAANQLVEFRWQSGNAPPTWMRPAILAAAASSNASRQAQAARFAYRSGGPAAISYTDQISCGSSSIGCAIRRVPTSFTIQLRINGHVFDWGRLRWCQAEAQPSNGCFDAQMVTLHELGHVQTLSHVDSSTISRADSVMHPVSHARPRAGWNADRFGRCDVAALQLRYGMLAATTPFSTCLDLPTTLTLTASSRTVGHHQPVTLTANLQVSKGPYAALKRTPISHREVIIQRRVAGTSTWQTTATMAVGREPGRYTFTHSPTIDFEWRAVFRAPADEGLRRSQSDPILIKVSPCAQAPCPLVRRSEEQHAT